MDLEDDFCLEEDKLSFIFVDLELGTVTLEKNDSNLIGISIGGGAKLCPCLYVVQVFDNTAAAREGTLQSGDEITGVNGVNVKGQIKAGGGTNDTKVTGHCHNPL
ncbi:hypothetical protein O3P69_007654 [Scylla paramamosain]|uniref:PDZ domain-containing protein n=1 Tax=Scylla paramamosain TaxID=85552 RepID=A0AAW0V0W5_SCYPA